MRCYGPLVSELGARVHGAPQLRHWGGAVPPAPGSAAYAAASVDRYLLYAPELSSKPAARRYCCRSTGNRNRQTDRHPTIT